jgi:hypothetical protein
MCINQDVAEPPELSGPHAPIIVPKTSDRRARVPNDSRSLSGVLGKPESSTLHSLQEFPHQALQYYNIFIDKINQSKSGKFT